MYSYCNSNYFYRRDNKEKAEDHMSWRSVSCCLSNNIMLSFKPKKYKCTSQIEYDFEIELLISLLALFPCPYCKACSWILYGSFKRRICIANDPEFIYIHVQRILCTNCNRTHALLPSTWLVRSPVFVSVAIQISGLLHNQFSKFQNAFYPLTDRYLYTIIHKIKVFQQKYNLVPFSEENPLLLRNFFNFFLFQHEGDNFFFLNAF